MSEHSHSSPPPDFVAPLLDWYRTHKRVLPWRDASHDPYAVWISEIMLQQTTVAAVVPYFLRWMTAFPTVADLAAADLQDVLRLWAGLGYYARARNIKKTAEAVVEQHGGVVPDSVAVLMSLPGIGRYTAGAIASIAYGHAAPILDGNVIRILSRIYAIGDDIEATSTKNHLWRLAENAIPPDAASDFNQAMMELGALVCAPAAPRCDDCPVSGLCLARRDGDPILYPRSSKATKWLNVADCCVAVERDDALLFIRRPEAGVWGGLWELPRCTAQQDEALDACAVRAVSETVGQRAEVGRKFGSWKHTVMNRRILLHGFTGTLDDEQIDRLVPCAGRAVACAWLTADDAIANLPLPSPQREILRIWRGSRSQHSLALA